VRRKKNVREISRQPWGRLKKWNVFRGFWKAGKILTAVMHQIGNQGWVGDGMTEKECGDGLRQIYDDEIVCCFWAGRETPLSLYSLSK
jgi:hypothetical protein